MRAPIGIRISSRRRTQGLAQAALARQAGISPSYLNLIERNKRDVGGALLKRLAVALGMDIDDLTGESEQKLIQDLEEAFFDPVLSPSGFTATDAHDLVAQNPAAADAIRRLHRAYTAATATADAYANRLRADPLFSQLLHQVLSGITAIRSGVEILGDVPDLKDDERRRFLGSITRESHSLSDVAQTLIGQFDRSSETRRTGSPVRELDDLIIAINNHFPALEAAADALRGEIEAAGPFGEDTLTRLVARRFGIHVAHGQPVTIRQYHYDPEARTMWFRTSATAATRRFQLARLYAELAVPEILAAAVAVPQLTTDAARVLARHALGSYLAGAMVFPYTRFIEDAEAARYDIDVLRERYGASFEQVAHRLVSLRRPGAEGVPFGFLRSDPAGRLTKHFPLPGLLLPNSGHACPLWAIYGAFRSPETIVRQSVQFSDGSRYLFVARTQSRRAASYRDTQVPTSVMLACGILHADRTVYGLGLDLTDPALDVPVGPSCRLCTRWDCLARQEAPLAPLAPAPAAVPV